MAANKKKSGLSSKQSRVIALLLGSRTVTEALAAAGGVGRSTLRRWMSDTSFKQSLQDAQGELIAESARRLLSGQRQALDTLADTMLHGDTYSVRRAAARDWLELSVKMSIELGLSERIAQLERDVAL